MLVSNSDIVLIHHGHDPDSYLVEQVPGLILVAVALAAEPQWVLLAVGEPLFSAEQESQAQQLMRRYGLDAQRFQSPPQAAVALHKALEQESSSEDL